MQLSRLEFTDRFAFFAIGLVFFPVAVALGGDSTAAQSEQLINVAAPQIILAPQSGDGKVDREIARLQQAVRNARNPNRSEEHTSELQSPYDLVCRLLLEK